MILRSKRRAVPVREIVRLRANGCREYCKSQDRLATQGFATEHILPREQGGSDESDNLALACPGCNNHKFTKTTGINPATKEVVQLFHPRNDVWQDHFGWSEDGKMIIGRSRTGRATIDALQPNRERLVNQRAAFVVAGLHPLRETSD